MEWQEDEMLTNAAEIVASEDAYIHMLQELSDSYRYDTKFLAPLSNGMVSVSVVMGMYETKGLIEVGNTLGRVVLGFLGVCGTITTIQSAYKAHKLRKQLLA